MTKPSPKRRSKRVFASYVIIFVLLVLSAVFFVADRYKRANFGDAQIDEIAFYLSNGLIEGQSSTLIEAAKDHVLLCIIVLFLLLLPVIDFYRNRIMLKFDLSFLGKKKKVTLNPSNIPLKFKFGYAITAFVVSTLLLLSGFGVLGRIMSLSQSSQLFEEHYVDPEQVQLVFPEQKRNLIYIHLESMENTIASPEHGGLWETSLIPELEQFAQEEGAVSFSHQPTILGGALPAYGTTWTVGSIVGQSAGVPLRSQILGQDRANEYGDFEHFLPGTFTLGDILAREGYNQSFVMGSRAAFGGRDKYLSQHGDYHLLDYTYAKEEGLIASDYHVWWGYEDKKMFAFAKEEALRLAEQDAPFNLQLLTVDTHFSDGYLDATCPTPYQAQYDNVFACSSQQIAEFVEWVRAQPFAENTTIILSGDHQGMQSSYYEAKISEKSPDYVRTTYNAILNSPIQPINQHQRLFTQFDMYPTTLAALGVSVMDDRLGLGVNLFSEKETLVEQFGGIDNLNQELAKNSEFYNERLLSPSKN